MRRASLAAVLLLAAAGCGGTHRASHVLGSHVRHCAAGSFHSLGSARIAYAALAVRGAVARSSPHGPAVARFGRTNANGFPTVFGAVGFVVDADCTARWYRVQLPLRPNGATAYVRASTVELLHVTTRIVVRVAARRLTLSDRGRRVLDATVAVGSPSTPTPTGRFYVNQRLVPTDPNGPFGPGAIGISAFSNVLTGWTQGGPVAIHGTNEPWSIGRAVSNGCIRLPNATLRRIWPLAVAGTPVIVEP